MDEVDKALSAKTSGPWFLESEGPGIVDLQYVSHGEGMALPWPTGRATGGAGGGSMLMLGSEAFEQRPSYSASRLVHARERHPAPVRHAKDAMAPSPADRRHRRGMVFATAS